MVMCGGKVWCAVPGAKILEGYGMVVALFVCVERERRTYCSLYVCGGRSVCVKMRNVCRDSVNVDVGVGWRESVTTIYVGVAK